MYQSVHNNSEKSLSSSSSPLPVSLSQHGGLPNDIIKKTMPDAAAPVPPTIGAPSNDAKENAPSSENNQNGEIQGNGGQSRNRGRTVKAPHKQKEKPNSSSGKGRGRGGRGRGRAGGLNTSDLPSHQPGRNLNHLLNFDYSRPERQGHNSQQGGAHGNTRPGRKKKNSQIAASVNVPYSKEQYVYANYRFLVNPSALVPLNTGEVRVPTVQNPDCPLQWDTVERVILPTDSVGACPICLEPPVAARITKCGHIFCFPCILHYLSLGQRNWRRCPLCNESVYPKALKSCGFRNLHKYRAGDVVTFVLVKRNKDSMIAVPHSAASHPIARSVAATCDRPLLPYEPLPDNSTALVDVVDVARDLSDEQKDEKTEQNSDAVPRAVVDIRDFTRILLTRDITAVTRRELQELKELERRHERDPAVEHTYTRPYTDMAMASIRERAASWNGNEPASGAVSIPGSPKSSTVAAETQQQKGAAAAIAMAVAVAAAARQNSEEFASSAPSAAPVTASKGLSARAVEFNPVGSPSASNTTPVVSARSSPTPSALGLKRAHSAPSKESSKDSESSESNTHFFYQSIDGQPLFLHSLNYRMLLKEYGDPLNFPHAIRARVVEQENFVMDEVSRRKFRFLGHIPSTTNFSFCEVDFSDVGGDRPLVSSAAYHSLGSEVKERAARRQRRAKEQARIDEEMRKKAERLIKEREQELRGMQSGRYRDERPDTGNQQSFPSLNPLGFAVFEDGSRSPAAQDSPPVPSLSPPSSPTTAAWSRVAGLGFANSEDWAALPFSPDRDAAGSAGAPVAPPELQLGAASKSWKPPALGSFNGPASGPSPVSAKATPAWGRSASASGGAARPAARALWDGRQAPSASVSGGSGSPLGQTLGDVFPSMEELSLAAATAASAAAASGKKSKRGIPLFSTGSRRSYK